MRRASSGGDSRVRRRGGKRGNVEGLQRDRRKGRYVRTEGETPGPPKERRYAGFVMASKPGWGLARSSILINGILTERNNDDEVDDRIR